jgi:ABC-2 type transport system permease protein
MTKAFTFALHQLRIFFAERGNLVGLILIPVGFTTVIGVFGGGFADDDARLLIDVADEDQSGLSTQFMDDLRATNERLLLCPFDNDEDDICGLDELPLNSEANITERLQDEVSLALIVIPQGFEEGLLAGATARIVYRSNEDVTAPSAILQSVQAVTQRLGGVAAASNVGLMVADGFDPIEFDGEADREAFGESLRERASDYWARNLITADYQVSTGEEPDRIQDGFGQSVPGMGTMFVLFTVFSGTYILVRDRNNWTLSRLATMPIPRMAVLGGIVIQLVTLGMIQYAVVFAIGLVVGLDFGSDPLALVLIMISFTLAASGLTLFLSNFIRTEAQAGAITTLVALTLAPLGGAWWPLEIVPEFMQIVGHVSPIAWAMDGFRELIAFNGDLTTVFPYILVLLGYAAVFFGIGVWRFRYE